MAEITAAAASRAIARPSRPGRGGEEGWLNFLFVMPFLVAYVGLLIYPFFNGLWISFHKADTLSGTSVFSGLSNYTRLFTDRIFLGSVWNTFYFLLISIPTFLVISLLLALALNRQTRTAAVLRAMFFATSVLSVTIVTLIWRMMFLPQRGLIANVSSWLNLPEIGFLTTQTWAVPSLMIATVWWAIGLPMMLFLAALQQVPREIYEAAELDNAGRWRSFWKITLPSIRRTMVLVVIIEIVQQFQLFGQSLLLTQGGPNNASRSIVMFIYEQGFRNWNQGYAAAASEVLFVFMVVAALLQYAASRRKAD
jgi:multiple sugar transport system permease protein